MCYHIIAHLAPFQFVNRLAFLIYDINKEDFIAVYVHQMQPKNILVFIIFWV